MAITNRPCKLAAISWRFRCDLSLQNRGDFEHVRILRLFIGDFFSLREAKTYFGVHPSVVCHKHGGRCLQHDLKKVAKKKGKAQVVIRTVNVVILRCCFAEDGTDLFISACCTCSTLIFRPSTNQILICGVIAAICLRRC